MCQEVHAPCRGTLNVMGMGQGSQQKAKPTAHSRRKPALTILLCMSGRQFLHQCSHLRDVDSDVALWIKSCLGSRLLLL